MHKNPNERPCRKLDSHRERIRVTEAAEVEPGHSVFINRCFYKVLHSGSGCVNEQCIHYIIHEGWTKTRQREHKSIVRRKDIPSATFQELHIQ